MLELSVGFPLILWLVGIAFFAGVGITTVGPGGIFVTVALYALTTIPSGTVAGTAHATFIATGLVGSAAYFHSGEIRSREGRTLAIVLSGASILGALLGAWVNAYVPRPVFGALLGALAIGTGAIIVSREMRGLPSLYELDVTEQQGRIVLGVVGFLLGVTSGLLGVGGPVLAVPALILMGVPMLLAVAAAQVQSIFIAAFATAGYAVQGHVSLSLAAVLGAPLLAGVVVGWKVAHLVDPHKLKVAMGILLIVVGPLLAL